MKFISPGRLTRELVDFVGSYYFGRDMANECWHLREALQAERLRSMTMENQMNMLHGNVLEIQNTMDMLLNAVAGQEEEELEEEVEEILELVKDAKQK